MSDENSFSQISDSLLFPKIFQTFKMAVQPTKLIIALLAVIIICLAGWTMDISNTVVVTADQQGKITNSELSIYVSNPHQTKSYIKSHENDKQKRGVFSTLWDFATEKFRNIVNSLFAFDISRIASNITEYFKAFGWAIRYHFIYCILFFAIMLAVISVAGGAICRISALQFAKGEKPGLVESLHFSLEKFTSLIAAPLIPIVIVSILGLVIAILGFIGSLPWIGEFIIAVFTPLAIVAGAIITVFIIGTVAGFNLMYPAIAYENSDCFDAINRAYNYLLTKPWSLAFYSIIAAVYGAICYIFLRIFVFVLLYTTHSFLELGVIANNSTDQASKLTAIWPQPTFIDLLGNSFLETNWSETVPAIVIRLCVLLVVGLLISFIISFYFSASTIIYAALRKKADRIPLEQIHTHPDYVQDEENYCQT